MVHLTALPGAPGWDPSERRGAARWRARGVQDARALAEAGFDAVLVENFGDAPWYAQRVPAETAAALAVACGTVRDALPAGVAVGVNVLRNDAETALAVAAAADLDFVRVNVLAGVAVTDQGLVQGRAAQVARARARLAPHVRLLADVRVKHARPLVERALAEEVEELVARAGADAVVVTGWGSGAPVDAGELAAARRALGAHPLLVGSGATARTVAGLLRQADGVIVGTALERGGRTGARVDPRRAARFVAAAREA
jgi:hypothetical protein